ncbi:REP-associated tyrosine transposase [Methyloversatilis universalis]|uniref:REP-associated tyrosine transposase n=1 Tax=Methyloversatilis universalis TaxID=378211 RepID=UPI00047602D3|nr:transposase [Methyloversatilis universalis]
MSRYRRYPAEGASWFFTVVAAERRCVMTQAAFRKALRSAIIDVRARHPFAIDAWVLLPDHLHCIWTLPPGDSAISLRWSQIKRHVSRILTPSYARTASQIRHRDAGVWQRRFWEHRLRDERDFERHVDYVHLNPLKHGLAERLIDWPHSTFHRYVAAGIYPADWCGTAQLLDIDLD